MNRNTKGDQRDQRDHSLPFLPLLFSSLLVSLLLFLLLLVFPPRARNSPCFGSPLLVSLTHPRTLTLAYSSLHLLVLVQDPSTQSTILRVPM